MSTTGDVPVFDRRLFVTRGSVVLTRAARDIMQRNAGVMSENLKQTLTRADIYAMRCVVDGLKLIHRDHESVKDILSYVLTLETYAANEQVEKYITQIQSSCFYIVTGSVKATYEYSNTAKTRTVHQPGIVYSHGVGEYLGMVSSEGLQFDLSSPVTVCTEEPTQLLRIDRDKFHTMIDTYNRDLEAEKKQFLSDPKCVLSTMTQGAYDKILPYISKLELPANKEVIHQGAISNFMYFIASGRCQMTRTVVAPKTSQKFTCCLGYRDPYSFFAEECILSPSKASVCTATTTTHCVLLRLHRSAHDVVCKDQFYNILLSHCYQYPTDEELVLRGQLCYSWNQYKRHQVARVNRDVRSYRKLPHHLDGT